MRLTGVFVAGEQQHGGHPGDALVAVVSVGLGSADQLVHVVNQLLDPSLATLRSETLLALADQIRNCSRSL
jgi:hypothetical protein